MSAAQRDHPTWDNESFNYDIVFPKPGMLHLQVIKVNSLTPMEEDDRSKKDRLALAQAGHEVFRFTSRWPWNVGRVTLLQREVVTGSWPLPLFSLHRSHKRFRLCKCRTSQAP